MDSKQNPPVDPAALAETKVLPRFAIPPGYRLLAEGEKILPGDMTQSKQFRDIGDFYGLIKAYAAGAVKESDPVDYFRLIDPVPHTKGRDKATCPHCDMEIEAAEVRDYQVLKGWAAGCDTKGCPGERDERKVSPRKATAIAAASAVWLTPQAPKGTPKPGTLDEVLDLIECAGGTMQDAVCAAGDKNQIISYLDSAHDILSGLMSGKAPEGTSPKAPAGNDCGITYSEGVRRIGNMLQEFRDAKHDTGERTVSLTRDEFDAFRQAFYAIKSPFPSKLESTRVSTLTDALTKAREALEVSLAIISAEKFKGGLKELVHEAMRQAAEDQVREALESPALVQALKGGAK